VRFQKTETVEQGIPVIAVKENKNRMKNDLEELGFEKGKLFIAENYLDAVGIMTAIKEGIALSSVRRALEYTKVESTSVARKTADSTGG